ncbi:MAG: hypothetical protein QXH05_04735, partial [Thermosphaera sp.]
MSSVCFKKSLPLSSAVLKLLIGWLRQYSDTRNFVEVPVECVRLLDSRLLHLHVRESIIYAHSITL